MVPDRLFLANIRKIFFEYFNSRCI